MKELVIVSGKGGTGKTSVVGCFAALAENKVLADCDVDAADLHLILKPKIISEEDFSGGSVARIEAEKCAACGKCEEVCRFGAISCDGPGNEGVGKTYRIDAIACEGCGVCARVCPTEAVIFEPAVNGQWYVSETRCGPMVHAKLGIAQENSGKLVSLIRSQARKIAEERGLDLIIIDGSPGIGCPVIASITGADMVLVVTEPTLAGKHDLERVAELTRHFGIKTQVCINKWDLNKEISAEIEAESKERGFEVVGRISYDRAVTEAQIKGKSVVEYSSNGIAEEIRELWEKVREEINHGGK